MLDDTRKLCLSSGETIPIRTPSMMTLFEVDELTHASPATVSRCGMVPPPPRAGQGWCRGSLSSVSRTSVAYVLIVFVRRVSRCPRLTHSIHWNRLTANRLLHACSGPRASDNPGMRVLSQEAVPVPFSELFDMTNSLWHIMR